SQRTETDPANPVIGNSDGYIISTTDTSATTFTWNMFLISRNTRRPEDASTGEGDAAYAAYTAPADGGANVFTDPDAAWADPFGRLFIGTDGGQRDGLQDQLVVIDTNTGEYKRLLTGVASDEITGITTTPDYKTMFTNTQHPGNGSPTTTNFPAPFDGVTIPRDCTLVVRKKDGGIVGS
ncbi:MAG: alkaline phosphatase PhoX, partial [Pseudomonadota bacterium]